MHSEDAAKREEGRPIRARLWLCTIIGPGWLCHASALVPALLLWTAALGAETPVVGHSAQGPVYPEPLPAGAGARVRLVAGATGSGLAYVDGLGRPRLLLGTTRHGPGLAVCDPTGAARGWLGFRGGGIGFSLWNRRELPQVSVVLSLVAARFAVHGERGVPRTALVLTGRRYAAAFFAQHGELRAASALGDFIPVLARFDLQGKVIREPFHHVLPGLFVDAVKTSLSFLARIGRDDEMMPTEDPGNTVELKG